jgi:hypothetical protein
MVVVFRLNGRTGVSLLGLICCVCVDKDCCH